MSCIERRIQSWDREFVSKTSPHSNVRQPNDDFLKNVKKTHFLSKNHLSAALPLEGDVFLTNLALPLWWCVDARQQRLPPLCITATQEDPPKLKERNK